ncbi:MAG: extracellular solute-binding protein, partial [Clostridia bacterium]|nr:extracellular solute-binding protein [Clostridia bacterium]
MKPNFKKIICLIMALSLIFALTACGGDGDDTQSTDSQTASNGGSSGSVSVIDRAEAESGTIYDDPSYSPYANIPESSKGVTVRYATWIDHTQTEGAVPLANFYNDTGIKVQLYTVKQSGYVSTLMTKIASGDIPDVFISNEADQAFPLTMQIAAPINKVSSVDLKDPRWDPTMLATGTIDGNVYLVNTYGSPWSGSNLVYFNKAIFEENGFKTPAEYFAEGTWTWDNMLKC